MTAHLEIDLAPIVDQIVERVIAGVVERLRDEPPMRDQVGPAVVESNISCRNSTADVAPDEPPKPKRRMTPARLAALEAMRAKAQAAPDRTCTLCGRVGKKWFTLTPTGWRCTKSGPCAARAATSSTPKPTIKVKPKPPARKRDEPISSACHAASKFIRRGDNQAPALDHVTSEHSGPITVPDAMPHYAGSDELAEAVEARSDKSVAVIAGELGVSERTVRRVLGDLGIAPVAS